MRAFIAITAVIIPVVVTVATIVIAEHEEPEHHNTVELNDGTICTYDGSLVAVFGEIQECIHGDDQEQQDHKVGKG